MKSLFLKLNKSDFLKGLLVAALAAALGVIQPAIASGTLFDPSVLKGAAQAAFAGGIAYLMKNFMTNSQGKIGPEPSTPAQKPADTATTVPPKP